MNDPMGRRGSLMPERARMMASATSCTASSWPIDPLVQDLVEPQQLLAFALLQPADGDAGPACDDAGDLLFGDHLAQQARASLLGGQLLLLGLRGVRSSSGSLRGATRPPG